jgi:hypothetical protein
LPHEYFNPSLFSSALTVIPVFGPPGITASLLYGLVAMIPIGLPGGHHQDG